MAVNWDPMVEAIAALLPKQNVQQVTAGDIKTLVGKLHQRGLYTPDDDVVIRSVNTSSRQVEITRHPLSESWNLQLYRLMQGSRTPLDSLPAMRFRGGLPTDEYDLVKDFLTRHDIEELFSSVVALFKEMSTISSL